MGKWDHRFEKISFCGWMPTYERLLNNTIVADCILSVYALWCLYFTMSERKREKARKYNQRKRDWKKKQRTNTHSQVARADESDIWNEQIIICNYAFDVNSIAHPWFHHILLSSNFHYAFIRKCVRIANAKYIFKLVWAENGKERRRNQKQQFASTSTKAKLIIFEVYGLTCEYQWQALSMQCMVMKEPAWARIRNWQHLKLIESERTYITYISNHFAD